MPAQDPFKRYLEAGLEFTEITRKRAEAIVKDLVKAGEVQREHTQQRVDELIERSRKASAAFADAVRVEVTRQLTDLGLVQSAKKAQPAAKAAAAKSTATAKKTAGAAKKTATKAATKSAGTATKAAKKAAGTAKKATGQS